MTDYRLRTCADRLRAYCNTPNGFCSFCYFWSSNWYDKGCPLTHLYPKYWNIKPNDSITVLSALEVKERCVKTKDCKKCPAYNEKVDGKCVFTSCRSPECYNVNLIKEENSNG